MHTDWYVVQGDAKGQKAVRIGDTVHLLTLRSDWKCSIEAPSIAGARQTTCRKGDETFGFTVQCDEIRTRDHTQIRFKAVKGKLGEYIEVGCEIFK
jgi:hypothetical protein